MFDTEHAFVQFDIRHFLSRAQGSMKIDSGYAKFTGDLKTSEIWVALDVKSVNTGVEDRDKHLWDADYFAADSFPKITFKSTSVDTLIGNRDYSYVAKGELTVKDIKMNIEVPFNYLGESTTKKGGKIYTFDGKVVINRKQFGIAEKSSSLSEDVAVDFSIEAQKQ
ncbi:MAG: YceI family protein [Bacteroidota bacterium]